MQAGQLFQLQEQVDTSHNNYLGKIAVLEERVTFVESQRDEAHRQVAELEAALYEHTSHQVEELEHALEQVRSAVSEFESGTGAQPDTDGENSDHSDAQDQNEMRAEGASA